MMILRLISVSLILLHVASVKAQVATPSGAWRQTNVGWINPPAELELKERTAAAAVLYFNSDHRFILLRGWIIQGPVAEVISGGDPQVAYLGTWKLRGRFVHVEYRLVSRTIPEEGESIPGSVTSEDIKSRGGTLSVGKDRFKRDAKLDVELGTILQRESARYSDLMKSADKR